ncbi:MAG: hypothetical protein R3Y11_07640 [Pseudomonadota bacterium]
MTLRANQNGVITGHFTIPENIPAGSKEIVFQGAASRATSTFVGQGTLKVRTLQNITTYNTYRWRVYVDPLAQTFTPERDVQLAGVDLWFSAVGGDVRVQIRDTQVGFPSRTVLAEAVVTEASLVTGTHTRILFDSPVALKSGEEYALVVLADESVTALELAQVGSFDSHVQTWVTAQPYTVGTLLSSSNASTWTAHQDKDLAFRLFNAHFEQSRTVALGTVEVDDATDLMVFGIVENPSPESRVDFVLTMPNGDTMAVASGQTVRLDTPTSGDIAVSAVLSGTETASPVLYPATQLMVGTVATTADYYTRSIPATSASKALLVYDADIPSGASVVAKIQKDNGTWATLTAAGNVQQGDGLVEFSFTSTLSNVDSIKARFTLTGTSAARPQVRNIRFMAIV